VTFVIAIWKSLPQKAADEYRRTHNNQVIAAHLEEPDDVDLGPEFPETNDHTHTRIHLIPDGTKYLEDKPVRAGGEWRNGRYWRRG